MTGSGKRPLTISALLLCLALLVAAATVGCGKKSPSAPQVSGTRVEQAQSDDPGSVSYDEGSRRLVITFRSGAVYEYTDVPRDVYVGISAAPAKGVYFSTYVKGSIPVPGNDIRVGRFGEHSSTRADSGKAVTVTGKGPVGTATTAPGAVGRLVDRFDLGHKAFPSGVVW